MTPESQISGAEEQPPLPLPHTDNDADERSLQDDLRELADEARDFAAAELAFQKVRASYAGAETGRIVALAAGALVLAWFMVLAVVVGAIIALVPAYGAVVATSIVAGTLALLTAILLMIAKSRFARMKHLLVESAARTNHQ